MEIDFQSAQHILILFSLRPVLSAAHFFRLIFLLAALEQSAESVKRIKTNGSNKIDWHEWPAYHKCKQHHKNNWLWRFIVTSPADVQFEFAMHQSFKAFKRVYGENYLLY